MAAAATGDDAKALAKKSDAWTDLALTLPIFLAYHMGVVFLPTRNAADPVTTELRGLADQSLPLYFGLTLAIGAAFVAVLLTVGQRKSLSASRFAMIAVEGTLYAFLMRAVGSYVVGSLRLGPEGGSGVFTSVVMSLGAGFYEEVVFRVGVFGVGAAVIRRLFGQGGAAVVPLVVWAVAESALFSGWHYMGAMGDAFDLQSFVFRAVCGLVLTAIFAFRGFAPAVWTHALYDIWVMVFG
jgi:hypothetical protein